MESLLLRCNLSSMNVLLWSIFGALAGLLVHVIDSRSAHGGMVGAVGLGMLGAIIGGFGASYYKSSFGAFLPLGAGVKVNFFDEASLFLSMQYRVPLTTETNNYHFVTSIGISGIVGKKNGNGK